MKFHFRLKSVCLLLAAPIIYTALTANKAGLPGSYTSCGAGGTANASCHATTTDEPLLVVTGLPASGWVPGTTYPLTASVAKNGKSAAGFDLYITDGTISNNPAGTTVGASGHELYSTAPLATTGGAAFWTFSWTASSAGGNMVIYFAGVGANNDGTEAGDQWSQWGRYYPAAGSGALPTPVIIAGMPTGIRTTAATVNATVNPNGPRATVWVQYGLSNSYTTYAAADPGTLTNSIANPVVANLDGLLPNTTYHYRFVAKSVNGRTESPDQTFTTNGTPTTAVPDEPLRGIQLAPNPAVSSLQIGLAESRGLAQVRVFNLTGQAIAVPVQYQGAGNYLLDVSGLSAGGYWLTVQEGDTRKSAAFQKL